MNRCITFGFNQFFPQFQFEKLSTFSGSDVQLHLLATPSPFRRPGLNGTPDLSKRVLVLQGDDCEFLGVCYD